MDNVSINGGAGDDSITLDSDATSNVIIYKLSDGNDVISGFNSTSTLQIGDGTTGYVSQKSGDDVLVTVGGGTITLSDTASLDSININGTLTDAETESLTGAATGITCAMLQCTAAGYPSLAGYLFHPEDYTDEEPTNYSTKDT